MLHVNCTRLHPGCWIVRVGDSSQRNEENVNNLVLILSQSSIHPPTQPLVQVFRRVAVALVHPGHDVWHGVAVAGQVPQSSIYSPTSHPSIHPLVQVFRRVAVVLVHPGPEVWHDVAVAGRITHSSIYPPTSHPPTNQPSIHPPPIHPTASAGL